MDADLAIDHMTGARPLLVRAAVLAFTVLVCACAEPAPVYSPRPQELVLHPYVGRLRFLEAASPAGARLLFDTGGGLTFLAPDVADSLHCIAYSRLTALRMSGERFDVDSCGAVQLRFGALEVRPNTAVLDLMKVLPQGLPHLDGLASLQTFDGHVVTLDLARGLLSVAGSTPTARTDHMRRIAIRLSRPFAGAGLDVFVRVSGSRGPLWFELDSGNLDPVILSTRIIDQLDLSPDEVGALAGGSTVAVSLSLDGLGPAIVHARAADIIYDGVLSAEFLERMTLVLDLDRSLAWAELNST